jgi:GR25 family glycosyltransferase involved in LPS biosynthesis
MIVVAGDPTAEYYSNICIKTWNAYDYNVNIVDAVTPDQLNNYTELEFKTRRVSNKIREFTETEKAVFYSHFLMWRKVAKSNKPAIILEHDCMLYKPLPDKKDSMWQQKYQTLCSFAPYPQRLARHPSPSGGYYLSSQGARDLINLVKHDIHRRGTVLHNNDFYQDYYWCQNNVVDEEGNKIVNVMRDVGKQEARYQWFSKNYQYLVATQYRAQEYPSTVQHGKWELRKK